MSPLRARIVAIARSQLGYRTDPPTTYCNRFSAYWYAGADDCGNENRDEEWCADFAAWVWKQAGAEVAYKLAPGYLNSDSASFYVWGVDHGTWHRLQRRRDRHGPGVRRRARPGRPTLGLRVPSGSLRFVSSPPDVPRPFSVR